MELQERYIGLTIVPAALLGVIANWLVIFATWRSRSLSHSFSLLTANQAVFNAIHSSISLFYTAPMIVLDSEVMVGYSNHIGFIVLISYDVSRITLFLITINRFIAVFYPITYMRFFNVTWTKRIILLSISLSMVIITFFFQILPCRFVYQPDLYTFTFNDTPICSAYTIYGVILKMLGISLFDVIVDMITIWKVRKIRMSMAQGHPQVAACEKKEIDCLKQSVAQSLFGFLIPLATYTLQILAGKNAITLLITMVIWSLLHSMEGVFTLCFNSEIRKAVKWRRNGSVLPVNSANEKPNSVFTTRNS